MIMDEKYIGTALKKLYNSLLFNSFFNDDDHFFAGLRGQGMRSELFTTLCTELLKASRPFFCSP